MGVWTIRIEGDQEPCTWLTDEGPRSRVQIDEAVRRALETGVNVIVGYEGASPRRRHQRPTPEARRQFRRAGVA